MRSRSPRERDFSVCYQQLITAGGTPLEVLKEYIQKQERPKDQQATLASLSISTQTPKLRNGAMEGEFRKLS